MAAPIPQQTATGQSVLIAGAPPVYSEKQPLGEGQPPVPVAVQQQTGQLPQGQYPPQVQVGGVLPQTWPQGYPMPQVVGQNLMPTMAVAPSPGYPAPHDFLMLAMVTTIICGILNLVSLAFGIPAIVLAAMSMNAKNSKNYPQAKQYGRNALILTIFNIIFTMFLALLMTGLIVGFRCADPSNYYGYYYYSRGCY